MTERKVKVGDDVFYYSEPDGECNFGKRFSARVTAVYNPHLISVWVFCIGEEMKFKQRVWRKSPVQLTDVWDFE